MFHITAMLSVNLVKQVINVVIMSFLSEIKYRYRGRAIQKQAKKQALENGLKMYNKDTSHINMTDLSVKDGALWQKRQTLMDAAHDLHRSYCRTNDRQMLDQLRQVYEKLKMINREIKSLSKTRGLVAKIQSHRDDEEMELFVERSMLDEHYRQKMRRWSRLPLTALTRKLTKIQVEREMGQEMHKEYTSTLVDDVDDEDDDESMKLDETDEQDRHFQVWVKSLGIDNYLHVEGGMKEDKNEDSRGGDAKLNLEERIKEIRANHMS